MGTVFSLLQAFGDVELPICLDNEHAFNIFLSQPKKETKLKKGSATDIKRYFFIRRVFFQAWRVHGRIQPWLTNIFKAFYKICFGIDDCGAEPVHENAAASGTKKAAVDNETCGPVINVVW